MFAGIHHIAIIASDYDRSRRFYAEVLGFTVVREIWRGERRSWKCDLALPDGTQIELFSYPAPPPRPSHPEAQGLRHLAFTAAVFDDAVAHLEAAGVFVEPIRTDPHTGKRFTFFNDPDGLPLEVYEP